MPESAEIYPESAYTLKEAAKPGQNTITKYEWNEETGKEAEDSELFRYHAGRRKYHGSCIRCNECDG